MDSYFHDVHRKTIYFECRNCLEVRTVFHVPCASRVNSESRGLLISLFKISPGICRTANMPLLQNETTKYFSIFYCKQLSCCTHGEKDNSSSRTCINFKDELVFPVSLIESSYQRTIKQLVLEVVIY